MRKLCPNLERDDALDTVLEVPIPEEMFSGGGGGGSRGSRFGCTNAFVKAWTRSHAADRSGAGDPCSMSRGELQLMLGVIGAPLIPLPVHHAKQSPSSVLCEQLKADPIVRTVTIDMIGLSNGRPSIFSSVVYRSSFLMTMRVLIAGVLICPSLCADSRSRRRRSTSCSSTSRRPAGNGR
jgi:hypothetical protein